jgi:hypothetical protein
MKEITTLKDGDMKVEFDGKELTVHLNSYNSKSFKSLNDAVTSLGSLLAMTTQVVALGKKRAVDESKDTDEPINLDDIPF